MGLHACCELGLVYHDAGQSRRAAWYFQLALDMAQSHVEPADAKALVLSHVPSNYHLVSPVGCWTSCLSSACSSYLSFSVGILFAAA